MGVDPGHGAQSRFPHWRGPIVMGESRQTQELTLAADAELLVA